MKKQTRQIIDETPVNNPVKIGSIFLGSFGYSMTIPAAYQVVRMTAKTVWVREIAIKKTGDGWTGDAQPIPDEFISIEPQACRYKLWNNNASIYPNRTYCKLWDGKSSIYYNYLD